jgi:hypothetical protein
MLNGIDPIIIFNFKKKISAESAAGFVGPTQPKIPIVASIENLIDLPVIPIYLSEKLTGIYIDSESKTLDIDTSTDTASDGSDPNVNQKGISNIVKIEMVASRDSIGVFLFSALSDLIFPLVTSKEYSITYLHGAVTVFGGLLHSFSINQQAENDLYNITLELIRSSKKAGSIAQVTSKTQGTVPLG